MLETRTMRLTTDRRWKHADNEIDRILDKWDLNRFGPCRKALRALMSRADHKQNSKGEECFGLPEPEFHYLAVGAQMETEKELLAAMNKEVEEAKKSVETLLNDVHKVNALIEPELVKLIKKVQSLRMTLTLELSNALRAAKEMREFFLAADYKKEMEALRQFIEQCQAFKKLHDDGTLDILVDAALKLAIGKEESGHGKPAKSQG